MVDDIHPSQRRGMLRELIYHQEAIAKQAYEYPPIGTTASTSSWADMVKDPAVAYSLALITESILSQGYHIEPPEDAPSGALAMAATIKQNLLDLDIEGALDDALNALWRGFWAHEITWSYARSGAKSGRYALKELAGIDPEQIALELDDHMKVTAVISQPTWGPLTDPKRLATDKMWFHVNKPSRHRPAGESILEPAYRAWQSKNRLLQFWGLSIQRFGMTALKVTIPANTPPTEQTQILSALYQGRLDGVYLIKDSYAVEAFQPTQWANLTFEQAIGYQDAEIAKALILYHTPGSTGAGKGYTTGTGIEAEQQVTAFRLQRISRALATSFNRQVIQPLCLANWGAPPEQCPTLVLAPPDPHRIIALGPILAQLSAAGIVDPDVAADQMGLPEPTIKVQTNDPNESPANNGAHPPGGKKSKTPA